MDMRTDDQMRKYVMRRVYFIYCTREVCKPIPRLAVFMVLALALVGSVSIANVVGNALNVHGALGFVSYIAYAFVSTSATVQVMTLALTALAAWFVYDTARNVQMVTLGQSDVAR